MILPFVEKAAGFYFRGWTAERREEATAEAVAAALESFIRLKLRGKDPSSFPSKMATRAIQHVWNDRHVGNRFNRQEILSETARRQYEFQVARIGVGRGGWREALADNTQTPVPDQVWFRLDVPAWLDTLKHRQRQVALRLAQGDSTTQVAAAFGVTMGRISQIRRELYRSWLGFQGELDSPED